MGREGVPAVPPKLVTCVTRFVPTNIGFPDNAEMTVQTTWQHKILSCAAFTRTAQEGTSTGFYRAQVSALVHVHIGDCACASLTACTSLLSSVTAFCLLP